MKKEYILLQFIPSKYTPEGNITIIGYKAEIDIDTAYLYCVDCATDKGTPITKRDLQKDAERAVVNPITYFCHGCKRLIINIDKERDCNN